MLDSQGEAIRFSAGTKNFSSLKFLDLPWGLYSHGFGE